MKHSWIDVENAVQEKWARDYLQKKRVGVTSSINGNYIASEWDERTPALYFLESLEQRKDCELSVGLLKMMKAAWNQQVIKDQKKSRSIKISLKSSAHLKALASKAGQTQYQVLENLILGQYSTLKEAEIYQKETRKNTLHTERLVRELDAAQKLVAQLKIKVAENTDKIRKLESELGLANKKLIEREKAIDLMTAKNLELLK